MLGGLRVLALSLSPVENKKSPNTTLEHVFAEGSGRGAGNKSTGKESEADEARPLVAEPCAASDTVSDT